MHIIAFKPIWRKNSIKPLIKDIYLNSNKLRTYRIVITFFDLRVKLIAKKLSTHFQIDMYTINRSLK